MKSEKQTKKCESCGKEFTRPTKEGIKKFKKRKYCSRDCFYAAKNMERLGNLARGNKGICEYCGKTFIRSRDRQEYCSISCSNLDRSGESNQKAVKAAHEAVREKGLKSFKENPTIKLGKRDYLLIYIPVLYANEHPELDSGWLKYHHFIWWKHYGKLPSVDARTHLHHVDGDKYNNSVDNLKIMDNSEHLKLHWRNGTFD